jgi:hypothetical protein
MRHCCHAIDAVPDDRRSDRDGAGGAGSEVLFGVTRALASTSWSPNPARRGGPAALPAAEP